jgi:electron transport complex protein RnfC
MAIQITGDGLDKWIELTDEPNFIDLPLEEMKKWIGEAGICGMGGCRFSNLSENYLLLMINPKIPLS